MCLVVESLVSSDTVSAGPLTPTPLNFAVHLEKCSSSDTRGSPHPHKTPRALDAQRLSSHLDKLQGFNGLQAL